MYIQKLCPSPPSFFCVLGAPLEAYEYIMRQELTRHLSCFSLFSDHGGPTIPALTQRTDSNQQFPDKATAAAALRVYELLMAPFIMPGVTIYHIESHA